MKKIEAFHWAGFVFSALLAVTFSGDAGVHMAMCFLSSVIFYFAATRKPNAHL